MSPGELKKAVEFFLRKLSMYTNFKTVTRGVHALLAFNKS